jgi:hypothetical protein
VVALTLGPERVAIRKRQTRSWENDPTALFLSDEGEGPPTTGDMARAFIAVDDGGEVWRGEIKAQKSLQRNPKYTHGHASRSRPDPLDRWGRDFTAR